MDKLIVSEIQNEWKLMYCIQWKIKDDDDMEDCGLILGECEDSDDDTSETSVASRAVRDGALWDGRDAETGAFCFESKKKAFEALKEANNAIRQLRLKKKKPEPAWMQQARKNGWAPQSEKGADEK